MHPHIRWMIRRDMPEILAIENATSKSPLSEEELVRLSRQRNCVIMVAENSEDKIVGYMIYELLKLRVNILNFTAHPDHARTRIGTAMMDKLIGKLGHQRRNRITVNVSETNLSGQLFLRSRGFRAVNILHQHGSEDTYIMMYKHTQPHAQLFLYGLNAGLSK